MAAAAHLPLPALESFDADAWDPQFEADVKAGRLDVLADEALAGIRAGC
jgi:hypothetical protein